MMERRVCRFSPFHRDVMKGAKMKAIKRWTAILCAVVMVLAASVCPAMALSDVTLSGAAAASAVTISGKAAADQWTSIKITSKDEEIVFFDGQKTDSEGNYSFTADVSGFDLPLDVTVSCGYSVETAQIRLGQAGPVNPGGSGGSGGGSGGSGGGAVTDPASNITVNSGSQGTVSVSPQNAKTGEQVTVTAAPKDGYEADTVKVTDEKGGAVAVTDNGDGTYTFTMPQGKVSVDVTWKSSGQPSVTGKFADVSDGAWYKDAVYYVADHGYFKGTSDTLFSPDVTMTRAMFATVIGRLAGADASQYGGSAFSDVPEGQWYSAYVKWASENDIVNGVGGGKFDPDAKITREQMAAMMYRYAKFAGVDLTSAAASDATAFNAFADRDSVSAYAKDAMIWATAKGIINGTGAGLAPKSDATRAQVAQIIKNYDEKIVK